MQKIHDAPNGFENKEEYVCSIFSTIATKYDFLNTALSLNHDRYWRNFAVKKVGLSKDAVGLDVCCGTGKLAFELLNQMGTDGKVTGLDFCDEMLEVAKNKTPAEFKDRINWVKGNAISLPFEDSRFDGAIIGFALRNVPSIEKTISEMKRAVKPGGKVVSLDLAKPSAPIFKQSYYFYLNKVIPFFGKIGIGKRGPYDYLPDSLKTFPHQKEIRDIFGDLGLKDANYHELTGGIVAVHVGTV